MRKSILTIEDNLIVAEDLNDKLRSLGYEVAGNFLNLDEILEVLDTRRVDLLIVDIQLGGELTGIDLVREIYKSKKLPVVYLTANSESAMVKMAMETHPAAYLLKPFKLSEFAINIDLAINNFEQQQPQIADKDTFEVVEGAIYIPDNQMHIRVKHEEVIAVEADGAYIKIILEEKTYQIASNLKNFTKQFNDKRFIRISRKHLVNPQFVEKIVGNTVFAKGHEFQFPKQKRQELLSHFRIFRTK